MLGGMEMDVDGGRAGLPSTSRGRPESTLRDSVGAGRTGVPPLDRGLTMHQKGHTVCPLGACARSVAALVGEWAVRRSHIGQMGEYGMLGMGKLLRRRSVVVATALAIAATAAFAVVALAGRLRSAVAMTSTGRCRIPAPPSSRILWAPCRGFGPKNGSATKLGVIHTAAPPMLDFTDINGGVDLSGMWLDTNVAANGDVWLYFAFSRESATTGQVAFEFQQAPLPGASISRMSPLSRAAP